MRLFRRLAIVLSLLCGVASLAIILPASRPQPGIATTAREISHRKVGKSGRLLAARVEGVVTYFDAKNGLMFVQDATGGVRVSADEDGQPCFPGERVTVSGFVSDAELSPVILNAQIAHHGNGLLPAAPLVTASLFGTPEVENRLVSVEGVVQRANPLQNDSSLLVTISQGGSQSPCIARTTVA
jgi:uncharacterized protein (DUF433 family)